MKWERLENRSKIKTLAARQVELRQRLKEHYKLILEFKGETR